MLIINTTFVVHNSIEAEFMDWLSGTLLPAAAASGCFATPTVARVLTSIEPDTLSIAVHFPAIDPAKASHWHENEGQALMAELHRRRGQHLMFFTTPMETVDFPVKTPGAHVG